MWSKEESAHLKQAFWTAFGHYMRPVLGTAGEPRKWLNYPTGVASLYFRAFAGGRGAIVGIEIDRSTTEWGVKLVTQVNALQELLKRTTGEEWHWLEAEDRSEDSRFYGVQLAGKSVYQQSDWPDIISFFKPRLVALDVFWEEAKWGFHL